MKVAVALSGGVDSFTAASFLKEEGHEVFGIFMYVAEQGQMERSLPYRRAHRAAQLLDIPFYGVDLRQSFQELVIQDFLAEYLRGRTPNPCVVCNLKVKFGLLLTEAEKRGAEALATGHYVRKVERDGRFLLLRGRDPRRDQSYFLWALGQDQLRRALFPLGAMAKEEVRKIAASKGYPLGGVGESREICFIPHGDYRRFLQERIEGWQQQGEIVDLQGRVLGRHSGIYRFTVGQRRGLGIRAPRPYYVVKIEPERGRVVVGGEEDLYSQRLLARGVNWIVEPPKGALEAQGQVRYRHRAVPCRVIPQGDGLLCEFYEPQRAITPGQALALYQGEVLLGGGWIEEVLG